MSATKRIFEPEAKQPVTVADGVPTGKALVPAFTPSSTVEKELTVSIAREAVSVALGAYCGALKGSLPAGAAQKALATNAVDIATAVVAALKSANLV